MRAGEWPAEELVWGVWGLTVSQSLGLLGDTPDALLGEHRPHASGPVAERDGHPTGPGRGAVPLMMEARRASERRPHFLPLQECQKPSEMMH